MATGAELASMSIRCDRLRGEVSTEKPRIRIGSKRPVEKKWGPLHFSHFAQIGLNGGQVAKTLGMRWERIYFLTRQKVLCFSVQWHDSSPILRD